MSQFRYQLRIVLDSGYVHITETYTSPSEDDALKVARSYAGSRAGVIDIRNDQGERVLVRTTKIASIKVRDVDNPPPAPEKRVTKPGSYSTHHGGEGV